MEPTYLRRALYTTAARDGGVRLWRMPSHPGALASSQQQHGHGGYNNNGGGASPAREATTLTGMAPSAGIAATALAFDSGGYRLFVGFADGMVREMQVDLGQDAEVIDIGAGGGLAGALTGTGGYKSIPQNTSLRPLRECKDMMGEPITCIRVTPNDRRVLARTLADRIAAVDVSFFAATHSFDCAGSTCGNGFYTKMSTAERVKSAATAHPLARCAVSPDGRWLVAGASDGTARLFDVDVAGSGVALTAADVAHGSGINDIAWSPAAHVVAVAAAGGARPLRIAAAVEGRRPVAPPPRPHAAALMARSTLSSAKEARAAAGFRRQGWVGYHHFSLHVIFPQSKHGSIDDNHVILQSKTHSIDDTRYTLSAGSAPRSPTA
jgi:WD40 repeat protein